MKPLILNVMTRSEVPAEETIREMHKLAVKLDVDISTQLGDMYCIVNSDMDVEYVIKEHKYSVDQMYNRRHNDTH